MKYKIDYDTMGQIIRIGSKTNKGDKKILLEDKKLKNKEIFMSKLYEGGRFDAFTAIKDAQGIGIKPIEYMQQRIERTMKFLEII